MLTKNKRPPAKGKHRSGFESKVADYLKQVKVAFEYEPDRIEYIEPATKHVYIPDFKLPNGIYIEAKGKFDRESRLKMALVVEQHKDKDIRILFMRNNKIAKNSKTRYSDWCIKRGIKYHVSHSGTVPEEWLNDSRIQRKRK